MTAFFSALAEMFSLSFMVNALVCGVLISLCSALLGVSLVLKRYSMIGDGLSHVAFGSLAVATALSVTPMHLALPTVILAAFFLLWLSEKGKMKGDALTALLSTGALAVGIMAVSLSTGINVDIYSYMFGSVLALSQSDVWVSIGLAAVVLPLYALLYHKIFAVTFDSSFARATGSRVGVYDTVLAVLTAITIVVGMRFMGTLLISALIVFPPLTAMRVMKSFRGVVICSAILPVINFFIGLTLSYFYETPPGASIVCVSLAVFLLFCLIGTVRKKIRYETSLR